MAAFAVALTLLGGLIVAAIALTARPTVRLPRLNGLSRARVTAELRRLHLTAAFPPSRYDAKAKAGTAVAQTPGAEQRVKQGSTVEVVLSKGPPPVPVPKLTGQTSANAVDALKHVDLTADVNWVAAPGTTPGVVTRQSPSAGHKLHRHQTVTLYVAETPTWRTVTSFSGKDGGQSVPFRIHGSQWRLLYSMSYNGTCDFVFVCNGPNAHVIGLGSASTDTSFGLDAGSGKTRVFKSGSGVYQVTIQGGWDSARWSIQVQDWY